MKIVITSLHNITHLGHLNLLKDAASLGNELIVIVNTDEQIRKRGTCPLFDEKFRMELIKSLWFVSDVRLAIDDDCGVADTLRKIVYDYNFVYNVMDKFTGAKQELEYIFAKGGSDRSSLSELPEKEQQAIKDCGIELKCGVGGFSKVNSTTDITERITEFTMKHKYKPIIEDMVKLMEEICFRHNKVTFQEDRDDWNLAKNTLLEACYCR